MYIHADGLDQHHQLAGTIICDIKY